MKKKLYLIFEIETPYFLNCKVECMDWGNFFLKVWYDTRVCHQLELVLEPFRLLGGKIGIEISWWIGPMFSFSIRVSLAKEFESTIGKDLWESSVWNQRVIFQPLMSWLSKDVVIAKKSNRWVGGGWGCLASNPPRGEKKN